MARGRENRPNSGDATSARRKGAQPANDSPLKAIVVTLCVCLAASILVTGSAVLLRPMQTVNKEREREARIAEIVARLPDLAGEISILGVRQRRGAGRGSRFAT